MRIVIDLQGSQTESRNRGIGRYSLSLAKSIIRHRGEHEIIIALNGLLKDTIKPIRESLEGTLPQENIYVWHSVGSVLHSDPVNNWRRSVAELIREAFLESLQPDIVHITSMVECQFEDSVYSIGLSPRPVPYAATFYDAIPLIHSEKYLKPDPLYESYYHEKLAYLIKAKLFLAISESSRQEAIKYLDISPSKIFNIGAAADAKFKPIEVSANNEKLLRDKFRLYRPFLMYSGATDDRKNHLGLISAFSNLPRELRKKYQLILVGSMPDDHRNKFQHHIKTCGLSSNDVVITGYVTDKELIEFYNLCELYIFPSKHEGFGLPALEAMSCGAAVIGSDNTSIPEIIGLEWALFNPYDEQEMANKIIEVLSEEKRHLELKKHGLVQAKKYSWDKTGKLAIAAFENWYSTRTYEKKATVFSKIPTSQPAWLMSKISNIQKLPDSGQDMLLVEQAIHRNHLALSNKQLMVDISELIRLDARTGVQRVTRSILKVLIDNPPDNYIVKPVYATIDDTSSYRYARDFIARFQGMIPCEKDEYINYKAGDIFLGVDLQFHTTIGLESFLNSMHQHGVKIFFVVYDLLPFKFPNYWPSNQSGQTTPSLHTEWMKIISQFDGAFCISRAVADEFTTWLKKYDSERLRQFNISWFHLGADINKSIPLLGMPKDANVILKELHSRISFLMVGTIEPRKGYAQTLTAFEQLWAEGLDANLLIVGKEGWMVEDLIKKLRHHCELGKRLFWLDNISDEYLDKVYDASSALIAASEGEGFGLPLIEAAQHKLPIIARDISVFREVAAGYAYYFNGTTPDRLASVIQDWITLYKSDQHPSSNSMPWLTWDQSVSQLLAALENIITEN